MHKPIFTPEHRLSEQSEPPGQPEVQREATNPSNDNDDSNSSHPVNDSESDTLNQIGDTYTGSGSTSAPLERLPAELRYQILCDMPDVATLKALVLASPVFHQQYLLHRHKMLQRALGKTLGNVCLDACAVMEPRCIWEDEGDICLDTVEMILDDYYRVGRRNLGIAELDTCDTEDLADMAEFHLEAVHPLMDYYPAAFLSNRDTNAAPEVVALSETERTRFIRALYRFQLFCGLFGHGGPDDEALSTMGTSMLRMFFGIFEPWEAEEIACIARFNKSKYEQCFEGITPDASEGLLLRGLGLFQLLVERKDHNHMMRHMYIAEKQPGISLTTTLSSDTQFMRRVEDAAAEQLRADDLDEYTRTKLRFWGDEEHAPPLGWVILWREVCSNWFGDVVPPSLQAWGYVFWDRDRLLKMGGKDDIVRDRLAASDDPRSLMLS